MSLLSKIIWHDPAKKLPEKEVNGFDEPFSDSIKVLILESSGDVSTGYYDYYRECWRSAEQCPDCFWDKLDDNEVKMWAYLPKETHTIWNPLEYTRKKPVAICPKCGADETAFDVGLDKSKCMICQHTW